MTKDELKKFNDLDAEKLTDTVGGHRHSRDYTIGHYVGKGMQALGVGVGIVVGIAKFIGMCSAARDNNNEG